MDAMRGNVYLARTILLVMEQFASISEVTAMKLSAMVDAKKVQQGVFVILVQNILSVMELSV